MDRVAFSGCGGAYCGGGAGVHHQPAAAAEEEVQQQQRQHHRAEGAEAEALLLPQHSLQQAPVQHNQHRPHTPEPLQEKVPSERRAILL